MSDILLQYIVVYYSFKWIHHDLFSQPLTDGILVFSSLLLITNNTSESNLVNMSYVQASVSVGKSTTVGIK